MIRVVVSFFLSFFLLPPCYRKIMYTSMCACVCEIHTIYIYRSLYCLYLVAVLISARRPLCTFIPVVIYLPAQPHQHHREERPCGDICRKRTDLSVSQSATRGLSPRHVRLEDTVKHISHRHTIIVVVTIVLQYDRDRYLKCLFFNKIVIFPAAFHRIRSPPMKGGRENDTIFKQLTPADLVLPASYDDHRLLV